MTTPPALPGCRLLEWDTAFFGRRIARLEPSALAPGAADAVEDWLRSERIECVYLLVDADDRAAGDAALARGFQVVDRRVTFAAPASPTSSVAAPASDLIVRIAAAADIGALVAIARASHHDTRFYADGHFERGRCDALYEEWIRRSCSGWADRVIVAEHGGAPVGYVTCHRRSGHGEVGLVAVHADSRGRGVGTAMIRAAREWFALAGYERVSVVTQGRNTGGMRLYEAAGFAVASTALWYHRWLDPSLTT